MYEHIFITNIRSFYKYEDSLQLKPSIKIMQNKNEYSIFFKVHISGMGNLQQFLYSTMKFEPKSKC